MRYSAQPYYHFQDIGRTKGGRIFLKWFSRVWCLVIAYTILEVIIGLCSGKYPIKPLVP